MVNPIFEKIKNRRKELGMSQDELASRLGYGDRSTISKLEHGKVDITQTKIANIAKVLGLTTQDLMEFDINLNFDDEIMEKAREIYDDGQTRILLDIKRKLKKDDLDYVVGLVKRLMGEE